MIDVNGKAVALVLSPLAPPHAAHDSGIAAETALAQDAAPNHAARLARGGAMAWVRVLLKARS